MTGFFFEPPPMGSVLLSGVLSSQPESMKYSILGLLRNVIEKTENMRKMDLFVPWQFFNWCKPFMSANAYSLLQKNMVTGFSTSLSRLYLMPGSGLKTFKTQLLREIIFWFETYKTGRRFRVPKQVRDDCPGKVAFFFPASYLEVTSQHDCGSGVFL